MTDPKKIEAAVDSYIAASTKEAGLWTVSQDTKLDVCIAERSGDADQIVTANIAAAKALDDWYTSFTAAKAEAVAMLTALGIDASNLKRLL